MSFASTRLSTNNNNMLFACSQTSSKHIRDPNSLNPLLSCLNPFGFHMMNTSPCSSHYSNASHGPTILHRVINPSMTVMNHHHFASNGVDRNGQYWPMNNVCSSSHTLNSRTHCNYRMPEDVSPVHAPSKETMFVSSSVPCQHVIPSGEHSVFPLIYTHESSLRVRCDSLTCPTTEVNTQHALTSNTSVDNKMYITEFVPNNSHKDRPMHEEHLKAGRRKKIKKENMENRATEEGQRKPKDIASNTMDDNHKNKRTKDQTDKNESTLSKKVKTSSSCSSEAETHSNSDPTLDASSSSSSSTMKEASTRTLEQQLEEALVLFPDLMQTPTSIIRKSECFKDYHSCKLIINNNDHSNNMNVMNEQQQHAYWEEDISTFLEMIEQ